MGFKVAATTLHLWQPSLPHSSSQALTSAFSSPSSMRQSFLMGGGTQFCRCTERSSLFYDSQHFSKLHRYRSWDGRRFQKRMTGAALTGMDSFSDDEFAKPMEELGQGFQVSDEMEDQLHNTDFSGDSKFMENTSPFDPKMGDIPSDIEFKASHVGIPLSMRLIRKKQQLKEGIVEAGESAYSSVKKAFLSVVFIVRELHSYSLQLRGSLYYEDLREILEKVQSEIHASFVWLFQKVFSQTPTLMVYVMVLLANYSVHAMSTNAAIIASQRQQVYIVPIDEVSVVEVNGQKFDSSDVKTQSGEESIREEDSVMGDESFDKETMEKFVSLEQFQREIIYQAKLIQEPRNSLFLANYAQFLYVVAKDFDRAEEYFKRATKMEPKDADALNKYAHFLWRVKDDLWAAEETYQEAISADPENTHYRGSYAYFLWNTDGEETCYPLNYH